MNIIVPVKYVPDLVEELRINDMGDKLDPDWLRLKLNEFDDHAIEEALILQENGVGSVTVIAMDSDCAEDVLFTAAAKGIEHIIKLHPDLQIDLSSHGYARLLVPVIQDLQPDLILTGVQAHNDLDGPLGPLLAEHLGIPYVGYIASIRVQDHEAIVRKELPGGMGMDMVVSLPAVLGIQAAEKPLRYVAFSKIRQAMKMTPLVEQDVSAVDEPFVPVVDRLYQPESSHKAEMLPGDANEVAEKLVEIFTVSGVF